MIHNKMAEPGSYHEERKQLEINYKERLWENSRV
jgi:hypothetical protein